MPMPSYSVEPRNAECFAVIRTSPRGAKKFIMAYKMSHQAEDVAAKLNQWANQEK